MGKDLGITVKQSEDTAAWYEQVCLKSEIADFGEIKGTIVIRPKGYYIWQAIMDHFNKQIKSIDVDNAYFPMLIPERFFTKEAEHAEGFAPELAWITSDAATQDDEKAIIRPTSETIIMDSFRKWLRTYKDLPIKINQWANVFRWEVKQTKLFLRGREFLWQEGHCVHQSEQECKDEVKNILDFYVNVCKDVLALPVIAGEKTPAERFAGAEESYTIEAFMPDGKALQSGTSHHLGQNFTKAFDVQYVGDDEKQHYPFSNSWGISTRLLGAVIMTHSDDGGLVLPPGLCKEKIRIVPATKKDNAQEVLTYAQQVQQACGGSIDDRPEYSMGFKVKDAQLKGVPLVIIVGGKEMQDKVVTLAFRDQDKEQVAFDKLSKDFIKQSFTQMHQRLYEKAQETLHAKIQPVDNLEQLKDIVAQGKVAKAHFTCEKKDEADFEEQTGIGTRCIVDKQEGTCIFTGKPTNKVVLFSKSY